MLASNYRKSMDHMEVKGYQNYLAEQKLSGLPGITKLAKLIPQPINSVIQYVIIYKKE